LAQDSDFILISVTNFDTVKKICFSEYLLVVLKICIGRD